MKIVWGICALVSFGLMIRLGVTSYTRSKIFFDGKQVEVTLTTIPHNYGTKSHGVLWFNYNGKTYRKNVTGQVDDFFYAGEKIKLIYLNGYEDNFLFPNGNPVGEGIVCVVMFFAVGIGCLYYLFKN